MKLTKFKLEQLIKEILKENEPFKDRPFDYSSLLRDKPSESDKVTVITRKTVPRSGGGDVGWEKTTAAYDVGSKELKALGLDFNDAAGKTYKVERDIEGKIETISIVPE